MMHLGRSPSLFLVFSMDGNGLVACDEGAGWCLGASKSESSLDYASQFDISSSFLLCSGREHWQELCVSWSFESHFA
ncbi:hypothetical protein P171DRAFT_262212 [Karstenula rhodostoma CBS 690.94]|uniref:Uncharacterized protein n=1 Tax=Karstenula rhodostoma CBS 690.94 TaxID=1392251 RepID=A0A9P4PM43_9PLEO|nr:hypothetical protein P171DRAFT_262212 [Karstenula rhodostoma CBS 690.94]